MIFHLDCFTLISHLYMFDWNHWHWHRGGCDGLTAVLKKPTTSSRIGSSRGVTMCVTK